MVNHKDNFWSFIIMYISHILEKLPFYEISFVLYKWSLIWSNNQVLISVMISNYVLSIEYVFDLCHGKLISLWRICVTGLTHWGCVMHICISKQTIIGSYNGLLPRGRQAIIWTNAGILLIGPLGTNFSDILIGIQTFSFTKMHLKMSSAKWHPSCLGLNVLTVSQLVVSSEMTHTWYEVSWVWVLMTITM